MLYVNGHGVDQSLAKGRNYLLKGEGLGDTDAEGLLKAVERKISQVCPLLQKSIIVQVLKRGPELVKRYYYSNYCLTSSSL